MGKLYANQKIFFVRETAYSFFDESALIIRIKSFN
jgi:hypothetical protein